MLIDEESRLREQVHSQTQNKAELKAQLRHSFEGKSGFRNTPEKDFEMEHSLKNIDSSSINVCPTCESYREEVKELKSKLSFSKKDSEKINLQNGELLKQIRLMAKSESAVKQTKEKSPERFRDISSVTEVKYHEPKNNHSYQMNTDISLSRLGSAIKPTKDELSFRTHGPTSNIKDQPQQETPFKPMNADLAETLRSLKESQNRLESFQMKFSKEKEDMSSMNLRKTPVPRQAAFGESNQSNAIKDEADGVSSREQYSSFMAKYGIDSEQSILPGKKDFGTQRKGDTSNKLKSYMAENWNEKVDFGLNNGSVESFYQRFSRTEEGFGLNREKSLGDLGKNNQRCTAPAPSKEISVFKDLDKIDSFFKQDDIKIRSRRDERLLVTLDERIKADRSVDLTSKAYSRYGDQYNEQPNCIANRKQRKSIGHAPQSRYLERLSRLYEGNDDYGGASFTNDQSFASMKRASSSMDRKALTNTDSFLKQINDRISNLVTK